MNGSVACLHTKTLQGHFGVPLICLANCYIQLLYQTNVSTILRTVNLAPCYTPIWPLASALNARDRVQTHMTFVLEACD